MRDLTSTMSTVRVRGCHATRSAAAAIPVVIEAHFGPGYPACPRKTLGGGIPKGGMSTVDESLELRAAPAHFEKQRGVQGVGQSRQRAQRDAMEPAALDSRDDVPRQTRAPAQLSLPPPAAIPKRAQSPGQVGPHACSLAGEVYRPVTAGL